MLSNKNTPSIRQLQLFSTLVEHLSISKVADILHISQPSVSIQLKKMAEQLQTELYTVSGRKVYITEAGEAVYQAIQSIDSTFRNLQIELNSFKGLQAGTLKLAVDSTAQYLISKVLSPFCHRYPKIDVQLTINNRQTLVKRLKNNEDDFYILSQTPAGIDVIKNPFITNSLVVVANRKHELNRQPHITLNRLQHYPFILREQGSGTRQHIEQFCKSHNIKLIERMTIQSNEAIKQFVAENMGLGILSHHTLNQGENSNLVVLDVDNFPIDSQWYLMRKAEKKLTLLAATFDEYMKNEWQTKQEKSGAL